MTYVQAGFAINASHRHLYCWQPTALKRSHFSILHRQNLALSLQRSTTNIPVFDTLGWGVATRMNGSHRGEFT